MTIKDKIYNARSAQELIDLLYKEWSQIGGQDLAYLISQLGGHCYRARSIKNPKDPEFLFAQAELNAVYSLTTNGNDLQYLIDKTLSALPSMNIQELSLLGRGAATLEFFPIELLNSIADTAIRINFNNYIPRNLSNLIQAFDIRKKVHLPLFDAITKLLLETQFKGFDLSEILNLVSNLAKRKYQNPKLYQGFFQYVQTFELKELDEKSLCHLVWSLAKIEIEKISDIDAKPFLEKLTRLLLNMDITQFKPYNIARLSWALGKLGYFDKVLFEKIAIYTVKNINDFTISEMINIIWGFGKLGIKDQRVISIVSKYALDTQLQGFNEQDISNLAYALALLQERNIPLFKEITNYTKHNVRHYHSQAIANLAWAIATLKIDIKEVKEIFDSLAKRCFELKFRHFIPQELANLAWAFATLNIKHEALFAGIADRSLWMKFEGFTSQNLSNLGWAYATLGIKHLALIEGLSSKFQTIDHKDTTPQHYSNMALTVSTFALKDTKLLRMIKTNLQQHPANILPPQTMGLVAYADVTVGNRDSTFLDFLADGMVQINFENATHQNMMNLHESLAKSNIFHKRFIEALTTKLVSSGIADFEAISTANLIHGLALLQLSNNPLTAMVVKHLGQVKLDESYIRFIQQILWSLAALNIKDGKLFQSCVDFLGKHLKELCEENKENKEKHFNQVYQFKLYCELNSTPLTWDKNLLGVIEHEIKLIKDNPPPSTPLHKRVIAALSKILGNRKDIKLKVEFFDTGFFIDNVIFILNKDGSKVIKKFAVEIMGDVHYNSAGELDGDSVFKINMLKAANWECIVIRNNSIKFRTDSELHDYLIKRLPILAAPEGDAELSTDLNTASTFVLESKSELTTDFSKFTNSELANFIISLAKRRDRNDLLVEDLSNQLLASNLEGLNANTLTELMWSFATWEISHQALFNGIIQRTLSTHFAGFTGKDLAYMAWSLAKLQIVNSDLFYKISLCFRSSNLQELLPEHLSSIAWAFSIFSFRDKPLFAAIAGQIKKFNADQFESSQLGFLAFAEANTGSKNAGYLYHLADCMLKINFKNATHQDIFNMIWALTSAGVYHKEFGEAVTKRWMDEGLGNFNQQDCLTLTHFLAKFNLSDNPLVKMVAEQWMKIKFDVCDIANIPDLLSSFVALKVKDAKLFQYILNYMNQHALVFANAAGPIRHQHAHQLYIFKTYCIIHSISLVWDINLLRTIDQEIAMNLISEDHFQPAFTPYASHVSYSNGNSNFQGNFNTDPTEDPEDTVNRQDKADSKQMKSEWG